MVTSCLWLCACALHSQPKRKWPSHSVPGNWSIRVPLEMLSIKLIVLLCLSCTTNCNSIEIFFAMLWLRHGKIGYSCFHFLSCLQYFAHEKCYWLYTSVMVVKGTYNGNSSRVLPKKYRACGLFHRSSTFTGATDALHVTYPPKKKKTGSNCKTIVKIIRPHGSKASLTGCILGS